jgi:hypothetical protein
LIKNKTIAVRKPQNAVLVDIDSLPNPTGRYTISFKTNEKNLHTLPNNKSTRITFEANCFDLESYLGIRRRKAVTAIIMPITEAMFIGRKSGSRLFKKSIPKRISNS